MPFIYADNAATTPLDRDAFKAMLPFLSDDYSNPSQPYSFSLGSRKAIDDARETIAGCIGCFPEEIFFTSGGTESDNTAVFGMASPGREIICSSIEHHAVLSACKKAEEFGCKLTVIHPDKSGIVSLASLSNSITADLALVSVMTANNEIGALQPIKQLAEIAHAHSALFHTDAVQALGHIPVNVKESGVDLLSASAHKFNGPKGIGFLYIKNGVKIKPFHFGGLQERGFRAGTENVAAIAGMAKALQNNVNALETNRKHLLCLEKVFLESLRCKDIDFILNTPEHHLPGLLSVSFRNADGEALMHLLDMKGIAVSTGAACDSKSIGLSHVIKALNLPDEYAFGTLRVSFGKNNSADDAASIACAICDILNN